MMFALGVELLMGRAIITRWDNREEPEWPPHPDRVFMSLVAAWGERGEDPKCKTALMWLESLSAPALRVSTTTSIRSLCTSYVPANDDASPISKKGKPETPLGSIPFGRARNGRSFPTVVPADPCFYLIWDDENATVSSELLPAMRALCEQVTSLGHSATPVRMWVESNPVTPNLIPCDEHASYRMRTFGKGRIDYLKSRFDAGLRPLPSAWQGYRERPAEQQVSAIDGSFDPGLIVLRQIGGRTFSLESAAMISDAIRNTLMSRFGQNPPEWLSGHAGNGSPSTTLRPAYLPLGFVDHEHSDGHLLGVAIAIPRGFSEDNVETLFRLLTSHGELAESVAQGVGFLGLRILNRDLNCQVGEMLLELDERRNDQRPISLRPSTWIGPSRFWSTVTPIVLPRFPRRELTSESVIAKACRDGGFPEPLSIRTGFAPILRGVPHARSFQMRRKPDVPPRPAIHAEIEFSQPVRGPVLIGAGRYFGFGVFRPHWRKGEDNE